MDPQLIVYLSLGIVSLVVIIFLLISERSKPKTFQAKEIGR